MRGSRVLLTLAVSAAVVAAASDTQQLECFAVDFDGNNHDAGTNDNKDFIKCGGAGALVRRRSKRVGGVSTSWRGHE